MLRGTGINHELVTGTISGLDGLHGYLVRLHRVDDLQHLAAEGMWEQSAQQSDAGKRDYFAEITGLDKLGKNPAKAKTGTEIDPDYREAVWQNSTLASAYAVGLPAVLFVVGWSLLWIGRVSRRHSEGKYVGWEYKFSSMDEGRLYVELGHGVLMDGGRSGALR